MYEITEETKRKSYKPYDVVTDNSSNVGFIQEVSVNHCQQSFNAQISYAVNWLTGDNDKHAWFDHNELTVHCNLFVKIAESSCHPMGHNDHWCSDLFSNWDA